MRRETYTAGDWGFGERVANTKRATESRASTRATTYRKRLVLYRTGDKTNKGFLYFTPNKTKKSRVGWTQKLGNLTILADESRRLVDPRMNIALLLNLKIRWIPNVIRKALGRLNSTVHSKQGVRSNGRCEDCGPQPSLECAQNSIGRGWVQVEDEVVPGTRTRRTRHIISSVS